MAYSDKVVKRFEEVTNNPAAHGVGKFDPNDPHVATGLTGAPACGDVMKLDLKLDPETDEILDVKFKTYGCGSAIASSSMFVEMLTGLTIQQAKEIKDKELLLHDVKNKSNATFLNEVMEEITQLESEYFQYIEELDKLNKFKN